MDEETEADCRETIRLAVRGGFDPADEMVDQVMEWLEDDDRAVDRSDVQSLVDEALAAHVAEQVTWASETDCDRLDAAFAKLDRQGVICLQDAGYTKQDGWSDVAETYAKRGGANSRFTGYCFFHRQDLERVIDGGDLYLAFGSLHEDIRSGNDEDESAGIAVGERIRAEVELAGFSVQWDGTLGNRIAVQNVTWQRRRND